MLHLCDNCPEKEAIHIRVFIIIIFSDNNVDDDLISYKQWVHTDRTTLVSIPQILPELVETACSAIHGLRPNHLNNKSWSAYMKYMKSFNLLLIFV